jgi:excisionase family DNA binding protein
VAQGLFDLAWSFRLLESLGLDSLNFLLCLFYHKSTKNTIFQTNTGAMAFRKTTQKENIMNKFYTHYDQLPIVLNADQLAQALGISRANAYQLMHSKGFPTLRIGKRMLVPKDKFLEWLDSKADKGLW